MKIYLKVRLCCKTKIGKMCCLDDRGIISKEYFCIFEHQAPDSVFLTYMLTYNKGNDRLHFVRER